MSGKSLIRLFILNNSQFELQWPELIDADILQSKIMVRDFLLLHYPDIIRDIREGYTTLSIRLKPTVVLTDWHELLEEINSLIPSRNSLQVRKWTIPVCYGGSFGKDLSTVAKIKQVSEDDIISIHTSGEYLLHFYGFLPGFMYLGGLREALHIPRKASPEPHISAGSVAIGGKQTGIYPIDSPGGWHILGRTPLQLLGFNSNELWPAVGDWIKFEEIDEASYQQIRKAVEAGTFTWQYDT